MNLTIPLDIKISESEVEKIVAKYLTGKYFEEGRFERKSIDVENEIIFLHSIGLKGEELSTQHRIATPLEVAAGRILSTLNESGTS